MKTDEIIEALQKVEFELTDKERLEILAVILHYGWRPTALEQMKLEEILKEHTQY